MGSFSWLRADKCTQRKNLTYGDRYKILLPKKLGGGYIVDEYYDYGYINYNRNAQLVSKVEVIGTCNLIKKADLYGLLAFMNFDSLSEKQKNDIRNNVEAGYTFDENNILYILDHGETLNYDIRGIGIDIGCYDSEVDKLEYPLKLVSMSYNGTYEECEMRSYGDPNQGFMKTYWDRRRYR